VFTDAARSPSVQHARFTVGRRFNGALPLLWKPHGVSIFSAAVSSQLNDDPPLPKIVIMGHAVLARLCRIILGVQVFLDTVCVCSYDFWASRQ